MKKSFITSGPVITNVLFTRIVVMFQEKKTVEQMYKKTYFIAKSTEPRKGHVLSNYLSEQTLKQENWNRYQNE